MISLITTGGAGGQQSDFEGFIVCICRNLQEVLMNSRVDVAKFLLFKHNASIDVTDWDGCSPKSMAVLPGAGMMSQVAELIKEKARKNTRLCGHCSKAEPAGVKFNSCGKCRVVRYCSRDCQVKDWKAGHKRKCKVRILNNLVFSFF